MANLVLLAEVTEFGVAYGKAFASSNHPLAITVHNCDRSTTYCNPQAKAGAQTASESSPEESREDSADEEGRKNKDEGGREEKNTEGGREGKSTEGERTGPSEGGGENRERSLREGTAIIAARGGAAEDFWRGRRHRRDGPGNG